MQLPDHLRTHTVRQATAEPGLHSTHTPCLLAGMHACTTMYMQSLLPTDMCTRSVLVYVSYTRDNCTVQLLYLKYDRAGIQ